MDEVCIDRRRLRTTFIAQRGQRRWSLRATVDPNHSPEVEGGHYLSATAPAQMALVEEIARDLPSSRGSSARCRASCSPCACDIKTLAREAGISRASLYRTWGHLRDEFEKRRAVVWAARQQPDPREARIARLRELNQRLTGKLARTHTELTQLKERHRRLLSVLAAKDGELQRLRRELETFSRTSPAPVSEPRQGWRQGAQT
ncbi:hypothetical protein [Streptomyces sp. NPDC101234]|uniref:hypothetical protein n=1 Tax=Streptomyces sp. NPDC101234 TaxID=3366138 RepID=UPI0038073AE5